MNIKLSISTQYFENYGSEESPHWKPKGEVTFQSEVSAKNVVYWPVSIVEEAIQNILAGMNSEMARYEYVEHQIESPSEVMEGLEEEIERVGELSILRAEAEMI